MEIQSSQVLCVSVATASTSSYQSTTKVLIETVSSRVGCSYRVLELSTSSKNTENILQRRMTEH